MAESIFTLYSDEKFSKKAVTVKDALIVDVYSNVTRSASFILKCAADGKSSMRQLTETDFDDLVNLRGLGTVSIENFRRIYAEFITSTSVETDSSKQYNFESIAYENRPIPISLLRNVGISEQELDVFLRNGLFTAGDIGDICDQGLTPQEYSFVRAVAGYLSTPITQRFTNAVEALKDREEIIISKRCAGATLEEIGHELHVTRERIRTLLSETYRKLIGTAELVAGALLSSDKAVFPFSSLINLFGSEEAAAYCKLVLQESEYVHYLKFSDSFIKVSVCGADLEDRLKEYADEIVGEGVNFYGNLKSVKSKLRKYNLDFFDIADIVNYLIHNKYRFYGDYVTRRVPSHAIICHDAIRKFFKLDIKLDYNEDNKDMRLLRQIVAKHYHGISLPPSNKALTFGVQRNFPKMILSGRGRHCPIEKVKYNVSLFEDVHAFITGSPQTSFYYSELFSHFQERFLAETNINNSNFLHGMLKYLYKNDFVYKKNLLHKIGEFKQDSNFDEVQNKGVKQ
jgi:DNA-binding CsgD family transcriptional regulator